MSRVGLSFECLFIICEKVVFLGYVLIFVDANTMKNFLHILCCVVTLTAAVDNPAAEIALQFLQSVSSTSASASTPSSAKDSITAVASSPANEQPHHATSQ